MHEKVHVCALPPATLIKMSTKADLIQICAPVKAAATQPPSGVMGTEAEHPCLKCLGILGVLSMVLDFRSFQTGVLDWRCSVNKVCAYIGFVKRKLKSDTYVVPRIFRCLAHLVEPTC